MEDADPQKPTLKQKVKHEFTQYLAIFLYLAFFFCSISTYGTLLLNRYNVSYFNYAAALINAAIVGKVILIGEYMRLGRKHESRSLFLSAIYKAIVFGLLVFGFHIVEEVIKHLISGESWGTASRAIRIDELVARTVIIFCAFVPLFAFRELARVMGEDEIYRLFFKSGAAALDQRPQP